MIVRFETEELKNWFLTPLDELRGKQRFSKEIIRKYKERVYLLRSISKPEELRPFRSLHFELLKGDRKGQCSLRLNNQFRLIITFIDEKTVQIIMVNEISKHYE